MSSFRQRQIVRRFSGGYYDNDGVWIAGGYMTIPIMASVQPLNANERQQYTAVLPEGAETYDVVKVYSNTPLQPERQYINGEPMGEADVLDWRGRTWKIVMREDWQSNVINHYRHVAVEVKDDESGDEESIT